MHNKWLECKNLNQWIHFDINKVKLFIIILTLMAPKRDDCVKIYAIWQPRREKTAFNFDICKYLYGKRIYRFAEEFSNKMFVFSCIRSSTFFFFFFLLLTFNANIIHSLKNHLSSLLHLTIVSRSNDNVTFR